MAGRQGHGRPDPRVKTQKCKTSLAPLHIALREVN